MHMLSANNKKKVRYRQSTRKPIFIPNDYFISYCMDAQHVALIRIVAGSDNHNKGLQ